MPEGDSLRRAASAVRPVLLDQPLRSVWFRKLRGHAPRVGDVVTAVEAVGKFLVISFDRPIDLHTHLGMSGSWRIQPLERPLPRTPTLRIVMDTPRGRALCLGAPTIETHVRGAGTAPTLGLGPDLSDDEVDHDDILRRVRARPSATTLAELLLDQTVAAGIGNVFKSEILFVRGLHPFASVGDVDDETIADVYRTAHRMLVANRDRPGRIATGAVDGGPRFYVYRRHRAGCLLCDDAIDFSAAGVRTERSTYWCPTCQPELGPTRRRPAVGTAQRSTANTEPPSTR